MTDGGDSKRSAGPSPTSVDSGMGTGGGVPSASLSVERRSQFYRDYTVHTAIEEVLRARNRLRPRFLLRTMQPSSVPWSTSNVVRANGDDICGLRLAADRLAHTTKRVLAPKAGYALLINNAKQQLMQCNALICLCPTLLLIVIIIKY